MKKFRFKFEALETVRKNLEAHALRELAKAQRALQTEILRKRAYQNTLSETLSYRESLATFTNGTAEYAVAEAQISGTKVRILQTEVAIRRAQKTVQNSMSKYLLARKNRRAVEVLREKALSEYRDLVRKDEFKKLNDIYVMRAGLRALGALGESE